MVSKSCFGPLRYLEWGKSIIQGRLSWWLSGKKNLPAMQETWVRSLGWEDPLEEEGMAARSSILAWRIPLDRGAWWAAVHWEPQSRTRLK